MKKAFALLLALLLILSCAPLALAEDAEVPAESEAPPLRIDSREAFLAFADSCALEDASKGRVFSLETDLDLSGADFAPIPYFAGTFLGNGHRISGFDLARDGSRVGFFRQIAEGARVSDLELRGSVRPGGTRLFVGGIAGINAGTIENCSFSGTVEGLENVGGLTGANEAGGLVLGCRFEGEVRAEHQSGGIAGVNAGTVENCVCRGSVNTAQIIPERKQSFDLAAFTEDDFLDLANIGGIAGDNSGVIRACRSEAAVGYPYTGYNVGGIAGKSSGLISGCENSGPVRGRRDVGGVVGQLIPHAVWDFSEDRLGGLNEELARLDELLSSASLHVQGRSDAIRGELEHLRGSTGDALDELRGVLSYYRGGLSGDPLGQGSIVTDPETGLPDMDLTGADLSGLSDALDRVYAEAAALSEEIGGAAGSASDDLLAVNAQLRRVLDCMSGMLGASEEGGLLEVYDLSADEAYEHDLGAAEGCRNSGSVEAESSAGGVAGSMAFEISFDMEDNLNASDFLTSDAKRYLFAVLRGCESEGEVSVRADCAGGVVGRAETGAVVDCVSMSAVRSQKGDYVGGIAGSSDGCICGCWARGALSGGKYVGGAAGAGLHILDCSVWISIERGTEYLGAVAGWADGEIRGNRYAEFSHAGVDGVSRSGQCDPLPVAELLSAEGVPEGFDELELRFVVDGNVVETRTLPFGSAVGELPAVPDDGARRWVWEDFDREHVYCGGEIHGSYTAPLTVIDSGETPPRYLVEGEFTEDQRLSVLPCAGAAPADALIAASLRVEGCERALTVHMRAAAGGRLCLLRADGSLAELPYTVDKSYLIFTLDNGASFVYLPGETARLWIPWAAAGGGAALLIAAVLLIRGRRKKNRRIRNG